MNTTKHKGKNYGVWGMARPAAVGLLMSCAVTAGIIAACSLVFVLLKSIAESAIVPLALISAAVGCFAGAFLCASMIKRFGILFGAGIGLVMFLIICAIGVLGAKPIFGTETAVKLLLLLLAGGGGGYLGCGCRRNKRK